MNATLNLVGRPKKDATRSMRIRTATVSRLETIVNARNILRREKDVNAASMTVPDLVDELLAGPIAKEYPKAVDVIVRQKAI